MKQPIALLLAFAMILSVFAGLASAQTNYSTAFFEQGSDSGSSGDFLEIELDDSLISTVQSQVDPSVILPTPIPISDSQIGAESAVVQVNVFAAYKEWIPETPTQSTGKTMGNPTAPVTIVEYSDFECPFCARFFEQTLPQIKQEFIDTGIAKLEFRHFPLAFHANARSAAIAAECASEQNQFWKMHDLLFQNQANLSEDTYREFARQAGLNMEKFEACYQSENAKQAVERDYQNGVSQGVSGTPSFFINGQSIVGAQPFSVFAETIKKAHSKFLYEDGYRKTYGVSAEDQGGYRVVTKPLAGAQVYLVAYNTENGEKNRKIIDQARTNSDGQAWFKVSGFDESKTVFSVVALRDEFTPAHSEKFELNFGERHEVNIRVTPLEKPPVPPKPTEKPDQTNWYRNAYWQCHDGLEQKQGSDSSCKPAELWSQYAQEFCQKSCNPQTGKCGVNTFQVDSVCQPGEDKPRPSPKPTPRFFCDESTTCELVHRLIERVDALEKRIRQLEEIINLRLGIQLETQPVQITAVEPTQIETSQGVIQATADTIVGVENGQPFVATKSDPGTKKTVEDPSVLKEIVARKLAEQGLEAARETKYQIEPSVATDGSLDYKVRLEIKNQTPIINWIVPTQDREFEVKATEIRSQTEKSGLVEDLLNDPTLSSNVSTSTRVTPTVAN